LKKVEEIRTDGLLSGGGGGVPKITGSLHLNCTYQEKKFIPKPYSAFFYHQNPLVIKRPSKP